VETCEPDRDQRENEALAGAPPADKPAFGSGRARRLGAARAPAINLELVGRHRQCEQGPEESEPPGPGVPIAKPAREQVRVGGGVEDVHLAASAVRAAASLVLVSVVGTSLAVSWLARSPVAAAARAARYSAKAGAAGPDAVLMFNRRLARSA